MPSSSKYSLIVLNIKGGVVAGLHISFDLSTYSSTHHDKKLLSLPSRNTEAAGLKHTDNKNVFFF